MSALPARPFGFGWEKKLHKTDEFSSVFRFKCARRGACLDVLARPNALGHSRLGLVVARKLLRRAVDRNRLRRRLRERFRLCQPQLGALDIVVRLKRQAPETQIQDEFDRLLLECRSCANNSISQTA
ncbi:ribonuclease P protein component [Sulfuritortus calidifontis]|uniref:Ribonuclease P protein component n=1 Tax=Sulfuritortus calidifontis TaxID=1914471 RepID=A0A4R3JTI6_9PROT|nr:ribonuclease P protein component [Sulfuritortus calidifontis]TCS70730.1 ribonuclease P protein component [Sulfuritortus calidifontis]